MMKVSEVLMSSEAFHLGLYNRWPCSPCVFVCSSFCCVCVLISSYVGLGPTLMTVFNLNYLFTSVGPLFYVMLDFKLMNWEQGGGKGA